MVNLNRILGLPDPVGSKVALLTEAWGERSSTTIWRTRLDSPMLEMHWLPLKRMVYGGNYHLEMDDDWGLTPIAGNLQIWTNVHGIRGSICSQLCTSATSEPPERMTLVRFKSPKSRTAACHKAGGSAMAAGHGEVLTWNTPLLDTPRWSC